METSIRPVFGRVLIKREVQEQTKGGIILPDSVKKRHAECKGVILALGETAGWTDAYDKNPYHSDSDTSSSPYRVNSKQVFKVGDKVIFGRHAGAWLDMTDEAKDDGTLFICQDQDILAVLEAA